ncbi:MAG: formate--tetrahydrofolate ligase [Pirellulaceae bacterium]
MPTDIEIARKVELKPIAEIAQKLGLSQDLLEVYGKHKAKLPLKLIDQSKVDRCKLILVSKPFLRPRLAKAKTTTSIGLSMGLNRIGKKTTVVLRGSHRWDPYLE